MPRQLSAELIDRFFADLQQALQNGAEAVRLDCAEVESVQSNHIAILWSAREMCETANARTVLVHPTFGLKRVIRLLDLQDLFDVEGLGGHVADDTPVSDVGGGVAAFVDRFEPIPREVDRTLQGFLDYLQRLGVPETARFDLQTIFYEIATNISQHAGLAPKEMILFRAEHSAGAVDLIFEDTGKPFDPAAHRSDLNARQAAQVGRTRGFGLPLIRKLTDDMSYTRIDDRVNRLRISKTWREEA